MKSQSDRNQLSARLCWTALGLDFDQTALDEARDDYFSELDEADLYVLRAFPTARCSRQPSTVHRYRSGLQEVARKIRSGAGSYVERTVN